MKRKMKKRKEAGTGGVKKQKYKRRQGRIGTRTIGRRKKMENEAEGGGDRGIGRRERRRETEIG